MSLREQAFMALSSDAFYCRTFNKLSEAEVIMLIEWIRAHDHLSKNDFAHDANRVGLVGSELRGRRSSLYSELLNVSNMKVGV